MSVVVLLLLTGLALQEPSRPLTVSAAVSLTDVLDELGPLYTASGGARIRFNYAASNILARQIAQGARVDVFISADALQMDVAAAAGAIDAATRVDLLGNRLAIVTRAGKPHHLSGPRDLLRADVRRIAIGDPAAVPAGVYARAYLRTSGVWDALQPKLVPVASVRAALSAVENGAVDAAIVYETDAVHGKVRTAFVVPVADSPRIVYPAAVVKASEARDEAARLLRFLCSDRAGEVFRRFRFVPLGCR